MDKIKTGSVVKLKGQNIKMTVDMIIPPSIEETLHSYASNIEVYTEVECVWFIGEILHRSRFKLDALELIN